MGNQASIRKINYEDVQYILKNKNGSLLINTLDANNQVCLIKNTINIQEEESIINTTLQEKDTFIIIYGKNCNDETIYKKYTQLISLGFIHVFLYTAGLFEWLCLQDIYGAELFPTTAKELDILKFKPPSLFTQRGLLMDINRS